MSTPTQFDAAPQQRNVTVVKDLLTATSRDAVDWERWVEPGRAGVDIHRLYRTDPRQATAFLVRFGAGAHGDLHEHLDYELMFVLEGDLHNDNGDRYVVGDLIIEEPNSVHRVSSTAGCTLLVVREAPTRPVV
jgi:acetyl-CoA synthetase